MRKNRYDVSNIINILAEVAMGSPVNEVCRKYGISDTTFYKWRSRFGKNEAVKNKTVTDPEEEKRRLRSLYNKLVNN